MDEFLGLFFSLIIIGLIISGIVIAGMMLPFFALAGAIGYGAYHHYNSPKKKEAEVEDRTKEMYQKALLYAPPSVEKLMKRVGDEFPKDIRLWELSLNLYALEGFERPPEPPPFTDTIEGGRHRDRLLKYIEGAYDKGRYDRFVTALCNVLSPHHYPEGRGMFEATTLLSNKEIEQLLISFVHEDFFKSLMQILESNNNIQKVLPSKYKGENCAFAYLKNTPLLELKERHTSIELQNRTEHTHIIGGSGHGKTQLIQYMVSKDLEENCCIVVIDSQKQMIPKLAQLDIPLNELTYITPEHSLALNLFDVGWEDMQKAKDGEILLNNAVELLEYVLSGLLDSALTPKQKVIFQFAIKLVVMIPDGNVHTFMHIMKDNNHFDYADVIDDMDKASRDFFQSEFGDRQFDGTKKEINWRIWNMMKNPTFARIFGAKHNTIDMFDELETGKLFLIDTDRDRLGEGAGTLGRLFIAMILQAAYKRFRGRHRPVYLYIDEAYEYLDDKLETMLETARKANIGVILAHQYLGQITDPKMRESFAANTATKFAGGTSDKDARSMAASMHCDYHFIAEQKKLHFAYNARGDETYSVEVPAGVIEDMPQTPDFNLVKEQMEEYYGAEEEEIIEMPDETDTVATPKKKKSPEADITPSDEW